MIGNNTLHWNQATMIAAVQYYLDNVVFKEPGVKVSTVKAKSGAYDTSEFLIDTTDKAST
jgi:hypothetical protein